MKQTWRAFAKINLDLRVLGKRPDGFHDIRTLLQVIDLHDEIRVSSAKAFHFTTTAGPEDDSNLIVRAVRAFERETSIGVNLDFAVSKKIPSGAGLGGASADAAVTLLGLSRWFNRQMPGERFQTILSELGSDLPFFSVGGRAVATGRGEELFPLKDWTDYWLVLVSPGFSVPTSEAYSWLTPPRDSNKIFSFCVRFVPPHGFAEPVSDFQPNDFELPLLRRFPELAEIKRKLSASGARLAALTGSGSTMFGVFGNEASAARAASSIDRRNNVRLSRPLGRVEYFERMFDSGCQ
jgi:4-diphosphocytidyl-2-C-methyl-D-erythritol kinase